MIRWLDRNQPAILSLVMLLTLATMYATGFLSASLATLEIGPVAAGALRVIFASIFLLFVATITGAGLVRGGLMWRHGRQSLWQRWERRRRSQERIDPHLVDVAGSFCIVVSLQVKQRLGLRLLIRSKEERVGLCGGVQLEQGLSWVLGSVRIEIEKLLEHLVLHRRSNLTSDSL